MTTLDFKKLYEELQSELIVLEHDHILTVTAFGRGDIFNEEDAQYVIDLFGKLKNEEDDYDFMFNTVEEYDYYKCYTVMVRCYCECFKLSSYAIYNNVSKAIDGLYDEDNFYIPYANISSFIRNDCDYKLMVEDLSEYVTSVKSLYTEQDDNYDLCCASLEGFSNVVKIKKDFYEMITDGYSYEKAFVMFLLSVSYTSSFLEYHLQHLYNKITQE